MMLLHRDKALDDLNWHWFFLNGYDEGPEGFRVRAVTFGEALWLDLAHLWDTGHRQKGGIVLFD